MEEFALEGGKVIGFVKARLVEACDDRTIHDIVLLLSNMEVYWSYDVGNDEELMRIADERVRGMKDPFWKQRAQGDLLEIRQLQRAREIQHLQRRERLPN